MGSCGNVNGWRIPFAYLEDIQMRFMKTYGRVAHNSLAYAMNDEFSRVLHQQMEYFSSNPNADTITRVGDDHQTPTKLPAFPLVLEFGKKYLSVRTFPLDFLVEIPKSFQFQVRTVMVENIEKILERGDRIELLVDKTSTIQDNSFHFKKQSRRLRQALWMKNAKLLASLTCLIVVLLYIIIAMFCGGITLSSCRS
eukprot:Gb_17236 [translate_table: standard]